MPRRSDAPSERRTILAALGAALAGLPIASEATSPALKAAGGWRRLRRVVTSEDANGRSIALHDGEPTNVVELNGTRVTRLWETPAVPAQVPLHADGGATAASAYRPGFAGTSFYVAELPGGIRAPHIPMHKTVTLDYMVVLSGRIVLVIDEREIELAAGDTIVQGCANHTWVNRWAEPCLLLFVVVAATHASADAPGARG